MSVVPVPVAASTTVAPAMGFPPASRAVTVIVDGLDPLLAVIVPGAAVTVDSAADTAPVVMSKVVLVAGARPPEAAPSE